MLSLLSQDREQLSVAFQKSKNSNSLCLSACPPGAQEIFCRMPAQISRRDIEYIAGIGSCAAYVLKEEFINVCVPLRLEP
jgi:hypothetical protein